MNSIIKLPEVMNESKLKMNEPRPAAHRCASFGDAVGGPSGFGRGRPARAGGASPPSSSLETRFRAFILRAKKWSEFIYIEFAGEGKKP